MQVSNGITIELSNAGSGTVTLLRGSSVVLLLHAGVPVVDTNVAIAPGGWAKVEKLSTNQWDIWGVGLTSV